MNSIEYNNLMAFHPGYYVEEIIDDMEITQEEFATRLGTTPKTVSKLVSGQINLTSDLAQKLSVMLGTGIDVWLNIQTTYVQKKMEIEQKRLLDEQSDIVKFIDYNYFVENGFLTPARKSEDKIINLCSYLKVSNLSAFKEHDFLVNFRAGVSQIETKNLINAQIWIQTAMNIAKKSQVKPFNAALVRNYIPEIRLMTVQSPNIFIPRLHEIFCECGVSFVLLPHLKNSGINGAVRWIGEEKVILAMNDRRNFSDTFWFSLFHEIKHVLQQKLKTTFISASIHEMMQTDDKFERDADSFAQEALVPKDAYKQFINNRRYSDSDIVSFANSIGIHPGIVVGRLQHDGHIAHNRCLTLKEKYRITMS